MLLVESVAAADVPELGEPEARDEVRRRLGEAGCELVYSPASERWLARLDEAGAGAGMATTRCCRSAPPGWPCWPAGSCASARRDPIRSGRRPGLARPGRPGRARGQAERHRAAERARTAGQGRLPDAARGPGGGRGRCGRWTSRAPPTRPGPGRPPPAARPPAAPGRRAGRRAKGVQGLRRSNSSTGGRCGPTSPAAVDRINVTHPRPTGRARPASSTGSSCCSG